MGGPWGVQTPADSMRRQGARAVLVLMAAVAESSTGGSPCLLSGSSAGSGGSSGCSGSGSGGGGGGGGGGGSGGRGYNLLSTEPVRFRTGGTYVCGE